MPEREGPKVCLAVPMPPPYGGISNWSRMITAELKYRGLPFEVVSTAPRRRSVDGRSAYERFVVSGVDMFRVTGAVRRAIHSGCDVLHITTSGQFAVLRDLMLLRLSQRMGIPSVYHIRFGRVPEIRERGTREWRLLRRAISLSTTTIAIDRATFRSLEDEFGSEKVVCIPNPVDVESLPSGAARSEKSIVYLGWLIPAKGIGELLEAWSQFHRDTKEWTLKLIGPYEASYRARLEAERPLDGVELLGEMEHDAAMEHLARASVFVLPSFTEGFPNVLLEAMALGRACVATRVGAIPEMLGDGTGRLVSAGDSRELLEALVAVTRDDALRVEMGRRARSKVLAEYSLDAVLLRYVQCWKAVVE